MKCFASLAYGSGGISTPFDAANLWAVVRTAVELVPSTGSASPLSVDVWLSLAVLRLPMDGDYKRTDPRMNA